MGLFSKLFGKKEASKSGGMEDYMTLVRVYFQASLATNLGINNLAMLPDLRMFKSTLHVPTVNNKLGVGEKSQCKKMLKELYQTDDGFFKEIDASIRKNCRRLQDVQPYLIQFQGFTQDTMMLMGNLMKWKFRVPGFLKNALRTMTEKTVNDILHKDTWKKDDVRKACMAVRQYQSRLGYSDAWISEYVYNIIILAKREPKPKDVDADAVKK